MDIHIRTAEKKDIPVIAELNSQLADYHREMDTYYKPGSETREEFRKQNALSHPEKSEKYLMHLLNPTTETRALEKK